ncbi:MAG: DUF2997 domain-containing protein [Planctomycetaceae bacterium]|nr:DUF2997 domain-containing protein [Planctomycetales bacterium]MCA9145831.1 DUF2997 domain-containing protein [Planctomycetales bacterium]MCB9922382.1 DUF2997 domain-containing protein [Planctomycetaceae bacterium]MCB9923079.1 DUF2997 domain-containing protein [Planctomycetaceae bacterium]
MKDSPQKLIEVIVNSDGTTRVETRGFSGGQCQEASRFLETALGRRIDETLTPEFYQSAHEQNQVSENL